MEHKKGQAGGAAAVIAIMAFLIVLYIMFLPPSVRNELLNQTTTPGSSTTLENNTLVVGHPGTLDPVKNQNRDISLNSFNLYSEKTSVVLKSLDTAHIENGWLRHKDYNLSFKVDDLVHTENYILALEVINGLGNLVITLNGREVYNAEVSLGNVGPITLDKDDIKNQNSLVLSISGVGLAFWRLNEYDLSNVRVIADFTDVSKREYVNSFVITSTEKENLETTSLQFVPDCLTPSKVGPLSIQINGQSLAQSVPDCGSLSKISFDPLFLKQGTNTITFTANEGNYFVDRVVVKETLKKTTYPFYYFELSGSDFNLVQNGQANVTLGLRFADLENKQGTINVNGHMSSLDTDNSTITKNINRYVEEGNNYVQITPITILNIVDLNVVLAK